ncbi:MAG TPA: glycosyltransferase family 39 protein [Terriglobales bacterium]|nr:glycosyltransferase family 39 protein [Terriglobales bacterium]
MRSALAGVGEWIYAHSNALMYTLLAAGLLIRIWHGAGTFLNSDEAIQFSIANKDSWWETYRANLSINAHPPLLVFLLHAWRHVGDSELMLRLPSMLAGTIFCWLTFKWLLLLIEESAAWCAFVLLLFSPALIELSSEVRHYGIFLAFAMASAYLLERALAKHSMVAVLGSGICMWLAIVSHFSAFLFAAVLGAYAIWRMLKDRPPLRVFAAWELGQIVALGLCYFFYVTQFPMLQQAYTGSNAARGWMADSYLAKYYFSHGATNPLMFIVARTGGFFQFAFGQLVAGDLALVAFVAGVVVLCTGQRFARINRYQLAFLLVCPFVIACAAGLLHIYPYGGIRHCAFLLPFAMAGIGVGIAWACKAKVAGAVMIAAIAAIFCNLFLAKQLLPDPPGSTRISNMRAAVSFIHNEVAPSEPILVDPQTSVLLGYYLCDRRPVAVNDRSPEFFSYNCGGHEVIVARHEYVFSARGFREHWQALAQAYELPAGSRVWVLQMGWNTRLAASLAGAAEMQLTPHVFGSEIQLFALTAGERLPEFDVVRAP